MSSKEFYSHVSVRFGKIYYRGWEIENGKRKRVHAKVPFAPTLYIKNNEESQFKSLFGDNLKERKTESISSAREYYKQYKDVLAIYGYAPSRWQYEFIARNFKEELAVTKDELNVVSFDIETKVGENGPPGVPDPYLAVEEITHIAFQNHRTMKSVVLTTANVKKVDEYDYTLKVFDTEEELLEALLDYVETEDPDILTAWYCDGFDTPYIINRIRNILGPDEANRLSPFGTIDEREVADGDDVKTMYDIVGRTIYDLKDLYTKFVLKKQESYSLDHISKVELGAGKLENPFKTFKEFYTKDPQRFLTYNFIDTQRVTEVDKKQGLIDIAVALTYLTKCTFPDVYSPVRYWECWIQNTLLKENTFVATERQHTGSGAIPGAYVEEPVPGFYDWCVSIDAAALYPSIMKCLNLSPETLIRMVDGVTPEAFLEGKTYKDFGVGDEFTLAANGAVFSKDKIGLVPRLVDMVLDGRKIAKRDMLDAKQRSIDIMEEIKKRGLEV